MRTTCARWLPRISLADNQQCRQDWRGIHEAIAIYVRVSILSGRKPQTTLLNRLSLLGLPGELRNRIYTFALIEDDPSVLVQRNYSQPGLLRTSYQLRREASAIYYQLNTFYADTTDLDFGTQLHFNQHFKGRGVMKVTGAGPVSQQSWPNLINYCRLFHEGGRCGIGYGEGNEAGWCTEIARHCRRRMLMSFAGWRFAARAFQLVGSMKHVPWKDVETALEIFKMTVAEQNPQGWKWV